MTLSVTSVKSPSHAFETVKVGAAMSELLGLHPLSPLVAEVAIIGLSLLSVHTYVMVSGVAF